MKGFKGTKGEWVAKANTVTKSNGEKIRQILGAQGACMTSMRNNQIRTNADAKLIAAAPDMLKALIAIVEDGKSHPAIIGLAEKAITKALGE